MQIVLESSLVSRMVNRLIVGSPMDSCRYTEGTLDAGTTVVVTTFGVVAYSYDTCTRSTAGALLLPALRERNG